jgi:hypothetical protein
MNAPLRPQVLLRPEPAPQQDLALATPGVLRYVWQHRFGTMLIEVDGERVFVNGQRVWPAIPAGQAAAPEAAGTAGPPATPPVSSRSARAG